MAQPPPAILHRVSSHRNYSTDRPQLLGWASPEKKYGVFYVLCSTPLSHIGMRILYSGLCSPLQIQYVLTLAQSHPLLDLSGTYSRTDILSCYSSQVRCTIDSAQDPPPQ